MASIFRNGKFWRSQVRKKGYPTITATFDTKAEAIEWGQKKEKELEKQSPESVLIKKQLSTITLREAISKYEAEILPKKAASTIKREKAICNFWKYCKYSETHLYHIDGLKLRSMINDLEITQGNNSIRLHLATLSHLYNIAKKEWSLSDIINPVSLITKPATVEGRDRRLIVRENEEEKLIEACAKKNKQLANMVILAIETAMRQGEIFNLKWSLVFLEDHIIQLPFLNTKTRKKRIIPLSKKAEEVLNEQLLLNGESENVFSYETSSGLRASFNKARIEAGIKGLTFHDLRHEATSRLFEKGLDSVTVQTITGHKTLQMLARYTHLSKETLVSAMQNTDLICSNCKNKINVKWSYCPFCATKIEVL